MIFLKIAYKDQIEQRSWNNLVLQAIFDLNFFNRTPSRLEAHLVYKHTQKPN